MKCMAGVRLEVILEAEVQHLLLHYANTHPEVLAFHPVRSTVLFSFHETVHVEALAGQGPIKMLSSTFDLVYFLLAPTTVA